jgi:hypothetical protein
MRTTSSIIVLPVLALLGCPAENRGEEDTQTDTLVSATNPTTPSTTDPTSTSTTDDSETAGSSGGEESSTSGEPADPCGVGRACLNPPPLGWIGPVVIARGDAADALPSCIDPYPGNEITRLEGFNDPGPAQCECECGLNAGACGTWYQTGSASTCNSSFTQAAEGCFQLPTPLSNGSLYTYAYAQGGAAACNQQASETIPEIPWDAVVKGCTGGYSDESCDTSDRICYQLPAEGFEQQVCYIAQGDLECPPGTDFAEKTVRFSAVDDTRECTNCQCGTISYCLDEYEYYTTNDCSGAAAGTVPNAVCTPGVTAVAVNYDFSGASCPVTSMSEPEGAITTVDPWTYCCATP